MTPPLPPPHPQFGVEPPKTDGFATAAFVLGLLATFCGGPLWGLPAIICAVAAGTRIRGANGRLAGSGLSLAGAVLGAFGSLLWVVGGIAFYRWSKVKVQEAKVFLGDVEGKLHFTILKGSFEAYHLTEGKWPGAEGKVDAEVDTAAALEALAAKRTGKNDDTALEAPSQLVQNGRLVDRWGNLLHVAYDLDGDGKVVIGERTLGTGAAVIWSNGPNGENEWGQGDDVVSW